MNYLRIDLDLAKDSYYAASAPRTQAFARLEGNVSCDVAVVGAGFAGLTAAIDLAARGFRVVVLEAREVVSGASGRNGGQVIHGLACDQPLLERQLGMADARRIWDMSIEALDLIRARCVEHAIDCDWRDGYLGVAINARKGRELQAAVDHLAERYDYPLTRIGAAEVRQWIDSPRFVGALHDPRSGHLHPLKYGFGLVRAAQAAGVAIHEHSRAIAFDQGAQPVLRTERGEVRARQVLLSGNVYLQALAPKLAQRIMPVGTYIAATEPLGAGRAAALIPSGSAVCDNNFVLDYFRLSADHRVIFGRRASYGTSTPRHLTQSMRDRMLRVFPQLADARIEHSWGGFVDITMNRAPDFGRLPAVGSYPANVYYLQGFSGHGVALTGLAGRLVAEAIAGDASRLDVFARIRHRAFPGGALLRTPSLVLAMAWYELRDVLGW